MDKIQMGTTSEDLLTHSRFIRDKLAPLVASKGHSALDPEDVLTLGSIMVSLDAIPMTLDLLRFSRIDKALRVIGLGSDWPLEIMMQAEKLVTKWEIALGSLQSIHSDLWGPRGRLQGIERRSRPNSEALGDDVSFRETLAPDRLTKEKDSELSWFLDFPVDPSRAYKYGHLGFTVGA